MSNEQAPKLSKNDVGPVRVGAPHPEPLPAIELRFCVKDGRDINLPGASINGGKDIIRAGEHNGVEITIEYMPWIRHHRVRTLQGKKQLGEVMIPESWCSWTPHPEAF